MLICRFAEEIFSHGSEWMIFDMATSTSSHITGTQLSLLTEYLIVSSNQLSYPLQYAEFYAIIIVGGVLYVCLLHSEGCTVLVNCVPK